jgi:ATP-dependent RNA helicase RhlE
VELLRRGEIGNAIVFCRTKHRANRLAEKLEKQGIRACAHPRQPQPGAAHAGAGRLQGGRYRVLVATDIVARGIDVEALEHVVNFDVPAAPEDYIHRVGRTARAEATGDAYTFVAPEDEADIRAIERAVGRKVERRTVSGFDYRAAPSAEKLEIPLGERIAQIRARKAEERGRAKAKAAAREAAQARPVTARTAEAGTDEPKRRRRRGGRGRSGGQGGQGGQSTGGGGGGHRGSRGDAAPRRAAS